MLTIKRTVIIPETARVTVVAGIEDGGYSGGMNKPAASEKKQYDVIDGSGQRIKPKEGGNAIKITSVSPSVGSVLRVGENVSFSAEVDYELRSANSGRVLWFLISVGEVQAFLSSQPVQKGKGTLSLNKSLQIRRELGAEPRMFVYLMVDGYIRNLGFDIRSYRLDQSQQPAPNGPPQITVDVASDKVDRIRIASISPSPEQSLRSGQKVDFEITVEYELTSTDIAELMMSFSRGLPIAQDNRVVPKGKGSVTVTRRMVILSGSSFDVHVALSPPSTANDKRSYTVSP